MKFKQKLTATLLAIITLLTTTAGAANKQSSDTQNNAKSLVVALQIMTEEDAENEGYVTRAYAAKTVIAMIPNSVVGAATGTMFIDVPVGTLYDAQIEAAAQNGLVYGVGDGLFKPNDIISDDHMAAILLRYAGYDKFSLDNSVKSKLMKNVNAGDALSYSDLVNMIYNVLNLSAAHIGGIGKESGTYVIDENKSILSDNFEVYELRGKVIENGYTGFWSGSDIRQNEVTLECSDGKFILDIGYTDIDKMIGRYVTVYYRYDKRADKNICLRYNVLSGHNNIIELSIFDIDFSATKQNQLSYFTNQNMTTSKLTLSDNVAVIYNGTYYPEAGFSISQINGMEGTVTAIDNDYDNIYDVLVIDAYEAVVVKNVLLNDKFIITESKSIGNTVVDDVKGKISLNPEDYDHFKIYNSDETEGNIEDLTPGMVLSVKRNCETSNKKLLTVYISKNTVSGMVTGVETDDYGRRIVELDYTDTYFLLNGFSETLSGGQYITLLLTVHNNAAGVTFTADNMTTFGIVTKVSYKAKDSALHIKMILANNKREEFIVEDKLKVDGTTIKDPQVAYEALLTAAANSQIVFKDGSDSYPVEQGVFPVRYRLRDSGELAEIDSPFHDDAVEGKNTLEAYEIGHYFIENNVMGGRYALTDSTPAFEINANPVNGVIGADWIEDAQYTSMSKVSSSVTRGTYFANAYKISNTGLFADFIIVFNPYGAVASNSGTFMIDKITEVYDEAQEELTYRVEGIQGSSRKAYNVSTLYLDSFVSGNYQKGDVVRLAVDSYGNIVNTKIIMKLNLTPDAETSTIELKKVEDQTMSNIRAGYDKDYVVYGYVKEREGNIIKVAFKEPASTIYGRLNGKTDKSEINNLEEFVVPVPSSASITVYNIDNDEIYTGSYDEIYDYKSSPTKCSFVALIVKSARVDSGIIYNYSELRKN